MGHHHSRHAPDSAEAFLAQATFKDALGDSPQSLVVVPSSFSVAETLRTLEGTERRAPVLSAPVIVDQRGTDAGLVDVLDLTMLLSRVSVFLRAGDTRHFEEAFFERSVLDVAGMHMLDRVLSFELEAPLERVAEAMLRVGSHRAVAVRSVVDAQSPIVAVLSQTQLLAFLAQHSQLFERHPETKLGEMRARKVVTVKESEPALHAFEKIQASNVSAVAVVDEQGRLVNSVSAANVRLLTPQNAAWLLLPVTEWMTKMNIKQSNSASVETTFGDAVATLRDNRLHRLWIVDAQNKVVSVLTVGDVLRRFRDNAAAQRK